MFKQRYVLDVIGQDERIYRFDCDPNAPLGEMHDALKTMMDIVIKQINDYPKEKIPLEEENEEKSD